jgi:signal transduction histidine kinase
MHAPSPIVAECSRRRAGRKAVREPALQILTSAASALASALLGGETADEQVQGLIGETATAAGLDRDRAAMFLYALAMRDSTLLAAEPAVALHGQLAGLVLFTSAEHASLWLGEHGDEICLAKTGVTVASRRLRAIARATVSGTPRISGSDLRALPVVRNGVRCAALVVRIRPPRLRTRLAYAAETARAVSPILERQVLLERTIGSGENLLESAERRVARLGFDIHDGPLQGLAVAAGELCVLKRELLAMPDRGTAEAAERRLEQVKALVLSLGADLRAIASTAAPGKLRLRETLEREIARLEVGAGIRVELEVDGDVDATTPSQRIAAARVVEEALANVREHSGARRVRVSLRREPDSLRLHVVDDGRGFDVARAMRRASRDGRLGLIGMEQRVRLLGGQLGVQSRPGGPTVISGTLPAWGPR